jgi:hypothetical protein
VPAASEPDGKIPVSPMLVHPKRIEEKR